jgi:hypothetical protein
MIYGYIFAFFGALATCASMAEMASMYDTLSAKIAQMLNIANRYPISGGQYHWVALLAPPRYAKFLSWLTGGCFGQGLIISLTINRLGLHHRMAGSCIDWHLPRRHDHPITRCHQ